MKDYIVERFLELAHYIIRTNATVRTAAKKFRVSKSTVHKDVTERLLNSIRLLRLRLRPSWRITRPNGICAAVWRPEKNICIRGVIRQACDARPDSAISHIATLFEAECAKSRLRRVGSWKTKVRKTESEISMRTWLSPMSAARKVLLPICRKYRLAIFS